MYCRKFIKTSLLHCLRSITKKYAMLCAIFAQLVLLIGLICNKSTSLSFSSRFLPKVKPVQQQHPLNAPHSSTSTGTTVPTATASNINYIKKIHATMRKSNVIDPSDPYTFGFIKLGNILGAHGVRGEVKVFIEPGSDGVSSLTADPIIFVKSPHRKTPRAVKVNRFRRLGATNSSQSFLLVEFEGVLTRSLADKFKKYEVYIKDVDHSIAGNETSEYMIRELVGLDCYHVDALEAVCAAHNKNLAAGTSISSIAGQPKSGIELNIRPIARVVGVVPPEELCESTAAASLMHSLLEVLLLTAPSSHANSNTASAAIQLLGTTPTNSSKNKKPGVLKHNSFVMNSMTRVATGTVGEGVIGAVAAGGGVRKLQPTLHCLIPMVASIVKHVEIELGCIFLDPPDGLFDGAYEVRKRSSAVKGFLPESSASLSSNDRNFLQERCTLL